MDRAFLFGVSLIIGTAAHQGHLSLTFANQGFLASSSEKRSEGTYCCCRKASSCSDEEQVTLRQLGDIAYCCKQTSWSAGPECDHSTPYAYLVSHLTSRYKPETCAEEKAAPCNSSHAEDELRDDALVALVKRDYARAETLTHSLATHESVSSLRKQKQVSRKLHQELLRRSYACPQDFECPLQLSGESLPASWSSRPGICRGVHSALGFMAPAVAKLMNGSVGTIRKESADAGAVPDFGELMIDVTGQIAVSGSFSSALVHILNLIEDVCVKGWNSLDACEQGVDMLSVVLAIASMSLAFNGVGVPLSALSTNFVVQSLGPGICREGLKESLKNIHAAVYNMMLEGVHDGATWARSIREDDVTHKAHQVAINFFRLFWAMLKHIPAVVDGMIKKVLLPTGDRDRMCCAANSARDAFDADALFKANGEYGEETTGSICESAETAKTF